MREFTRALPECVPSKVLCLAILSVLSHSVEAQVRYGLKGGINVSDVVINNLTDPDAESDYDFKMGVHAGVFLSADLDETTGFAAELVYADKGVNAITSIHLHYITLPLLARYHIGNGFIAEAGPEIGYLFSAQSKYGNLNHIWDNRIDVGLDLGIQYEASSLTFGLRFNAGISSVIRNAVGTSGEQIKYQNRVLQLSVAYALKEIDL